QGAGYRRVEAQDHGPGASVFEVGEREDPGRRRRGGSDWSLREGLGGVMKFFEGVANIFKVADLRKRLMFTLALLAVYRLGGHIPTPGIDAIRFANFVDQNQGGFLGYLNLFSGGSF